MMKLYIRVIDSEVKDHPVVEENLLQAFPNFDILTNNYNYKVFVRSPEPNLNDWQINEGFYYEIIDEKVIDVWNIRDMTQQEAENKKQELLNECSNAANYFLIGLNKGYGLENKTEQQIEEFKNKLINLKNNPVLYPNFSYPDFIAEDTGQKAPDRYGWN